MVEDRKINGFQQIMSPAASYELNERFSTTSSQSSLEITNLYIRH